MKIILFFFLFITPTVQAEYWNDINLSYQGLCKEIGYKKSYTKKNLKGNRFISEGFDQWYFRSNIDFTPNLGMNDWVYRELARLNKAFSESGIKLVLIFPPNKALVQSKKVNNLEVFGKDFDHSSSEKNYLIRIKTLNDSGVITPDLSPLHDWNEEERPLFLRQDSHWSEGRCLSG